MPDDSSSRLSPRDLLLLSRSLSRRTSSVLRESERVSVAVRRDIARCRHTAQALAAGDFLSALFDEIGFRYSLPGRELMLRAARVYVRLSADELCPFHLPAGSDGALRRGRALGRRTAVLSAGHGARRRARRFVPA